VQRGPSLDVLHGAITRVNGADLGFRCARAGSLRLGERGIVLVQTDEGPRRARVVVREVSDLCLTLHLEEALDSADRREHGRADVALRYVVGGSPGPRRAGQGAGLSALPPDARWRTEVVVLSPNGMRAPIDGGWSIGDRLSMRIHVPGPRGGDHFVLQVEVVHRFPEEGANDLAVRFLDLTDAERVRLSEIVDDARLAEMAGDDDWVSG